MEVSREVKSIGTHEISDKDVTDEVMAPFEKLMEKTLEENKFASCVIVFGKTASCIRAIGNKRVLFYELLSALKQLIGEGEAKNDGIPN